MKKPQRSMGIDVNTFNNDPDAIKHALKIVLKNDADIIVVCGLGSIVEDSQLFTLLHEAYRSGHTLYFAHNEDEAPTGTRWAFPDDDGYKGASFATCN